MSEQIRQALQQILDAHEDGWSCASYVVAFGLERITSAGELETSKWWFAPAGQHEDFTARLSEYLFDAVNNTFEDTDL